MTTDGIVLLAELFKAAEEGRALHPVAAERVVRAVLAVIRTGCSLDQALGLASAGVSLPTRQLAQLRRDDLLARAADALFLGRTATSWERAQRLATEVRSVARGGRALRRLNDPPVHWSVARQLIWLAGREGPRVPCSDTALFRILRETTTRDDRRLAALALARFA